MSVRPVHRGGVAALALALLLTGCADASPTPSAPPTAPPPPPTASIDVSSLPVPTVADLAIPVGLDDTALPAAVIAAVDRWVAAGVGSETTELADALDVTTDPDEYSDGGLWAGDFALLVAQGQTPVHAEALFGPDWRETIPTSTIGTLEVMNAAAITTALVGYATPAFTEASFSLAEVQGITRDVDGATTYAAQVRDAYGHHRTWSFTVVELDGRAVLSSPLDLLL